MINVVPLFLVINAGAAFGMWEATLSLGQAVGLLVTAMFSPIIVGASIVYALTSAPSDAIHLSCGAIFGMAQVSGLSGFDLIFGLARFCINHSEIYSDHGKHTNWVESYFSRLRRMVQGQHHHVSPQYLYQYANHAAWLEDNRRTDNGTLAHIMVSNSMEAPVSRNWKGYWQRAA